MKSLSETAYISKNLEDTRKLAVSFLENLTPRKKEATVVCLKGDLGSGKTAFIKELGGLLGIRKAEITSPTFVIEKIYSITHPHFHHLIHIDAYRLEGGHELVTLGWNEIVSDPKNLICIEWPERVANVVPENSEKIDFEFVDTTTRKIKIEKKE